MKKNIFIGACLVFIFLVLATVYFWGQIYTSKNPSAGKVVFSVEKGQSAKEIALNLKRQGIINSAGVFRIYVLIGDFSGGLQAGEYDLSPSMTIPEIVDMLLSGRVNKINITIVEGWDLNDIAFYLAQKNLVSEDDFLTTVGADDVLLDWISVPSFVADFDFLADKLNGVGLEGYLFPDTYQIQKGEGKEQIIRKMLDNFGEKLTPELRQEIARQKKTIFEIITMASLIEKEVRTVEDKKIVSGLLWKRLKVGMPLQIDATIAYITKKKTTRFSTEETKIDSPYNTYKYRGLPLGPISNPGMESIIAAIYPEESDFWYYLSTKEGKTIFSRTLDEHNIAVAKYLK